MCEPLGTGAADGALAPGCGNEVFPFLRRASFEQFAGPLLIFFIQRRIVQNALDVGQSCPIPVGNPGGLDKFAKVLVAAAIMHPATIGALEIPAPDAGARRHRLGRVMHVQATGADGREHTVKQGHLDALAHAAALPGVQGQGDTDCGLEGGVDRRDGNGRIDGALGCAVVGPKRRAGRAHHAFKGAHSSARIV